MKLFNRILSAVVAAGAVSMLAMPAAAQAPATLRIGSTLALTGPLATTALTHKLAGEIYVDQLNDRDGLLGRQVEWIVTDAQSKPEMARTRSDVRRVGAEYVCPSKTQWSSYP